jgi:Tol biopolymer transport system component
MRYTRLASARVTRPRSLPMRMVAAILSMGLLLAAVGAAEGTTAKTTRVSVRSNGDQADSESNSSSISAGGRFVAFTSPASNLVPGDTNDAWDVFVHDRQTGTTSRVSVRSNGHQGNNDSQAPLISAGGRYVAFISGASNLVPGDTNDTFDVFVHDRQTGTTSRVSVRSNGDQGNLTSGGGASISADGRFVAFTSVASNLVPGDTNAQPDVFLHDRQTGKTTRVSVRSTADQANSNSYSPSISADGRYVAFQSNASNLITGDTNGADDIFVHNRQTGKTSRVSVRSNGNQADHVSWAPSISADGRFVAFASHAHLVRGDTNDAADIFVHDRQTGKTTRVSVRSNADQANRRSDEPSISANGRFVAFHSFASNLITGDTNHTVDVFVHDRTTGTTTRVSVRSNADQANDFSYSPSISAAGRYVAFHSYATNLITGDTNDMPDVFVHGPLH